MFIELHCIRKESAGFMVACFEGCSLKPSSGYFCKFIPLGCLGKDVQSKWNEVKTLVPQRDQTLQEINQSIISSIIDFELHGMMFVL